MRLEIFYYDRQQECMKTIALPEDTDLIAIDIPEQHFDNDQLEVQFIPRLQVCVSTYSVTISRLDKIKQLSMEVYHQLLSEHRA